MKRSLIETEKHSSCHWLVPPETLKLNIGEVHVWSVCLDLTETDVETMLHILSSEEKERAARFHFHKDRDNFIASHGLLRVILGRYLRMNPNALHFRTGTHGKPSLSGKSGGKDIRFSVSHSHDLALFAFSRNMDIGVDLEYIRHGLATESIAEEVFSQNECAALNGLSLHERQKVFYSIWTRKEACLKALGIGLSHDMKRYDVMTDRSTPVWSLRNIDAGNGYAAAIAVMGHDWKLTCFQY